MKNFLKHLLIITVIAIGVSLIASVLVGIFLFIENPVLCMVCAFIYIVILTSILTYHRKP